VRVQIRPNPQAGAASCFRPTRLTTDGSSPSQVISLGCFAGAKQVAAIPRGTDTTYFRANACMTKAAGTATLSQTY
jgi:hypothetical protein